MKRISTATRVLNKFGAGKDGYTDGDVVGGIASTDLEAALFDNLQEEIANVVEAAGIVLDGSVRNQLLLALRAAGVFTTPPQFDNTTKLATSAFVQRAAGNISGSALVNANTTLTAANVGGVIELYGGTPFTVTMPLISALGFLSKISFLNLATVAVTLAKQAPDLFLMQATNPATITIGPGETIEMCSFNGWVVTGGSVLQRAAPQFASVITATGYKRLPDFNSPTGYLIEQWASLSGVPVGAGSTYSLPVAFPNAFLSLVASHNGGSVGTLNVEAAVTGLGSVLITHNSAGVANVMYRALGY